MPAMKTSRKLVLLAVALLIMTPSSRSRTQTKPNAKRTARQVAASDWATRTLRKMTLHEKIGQMLMVPFFGEFTSTESPAYKELLHQIDDNSVGGLIIATNRGPLGLRRSQVYPTVALLNDLQRASNVPLLVGADFENGTRMRLEEGTSLPSPMAIAATGDPKLAYEAGRALAIEARAAGVQWIFAPDADVNSNPANPIINVRSFGEDPREVSRYVSEYVRGIEENGAIATAKHFPGHGNVSVDSHLALASVPGTRAELEKTELVPFRAAIDAGVGSVMPGHLEVAAFEKTPGTPATLSKSILTGVLRDQMQFRGLIVTDAMEMGGVTSRYDAGEAAVRAVEAGEDVILMSPAPDAAIAAIERAVQSGRIPEKRIDESVLRILSAKERLGLNRNALIDMDRLNQTFAAPATMALSQSIADRGVTLLRDANGTLPLDPSRKLRVLLVSLSGDPDANPGETIEPELRRQFGSMQVLRADTRFSGVANLKLPSVESYDMAIAALFVRVADGKGNVGLPEDQRAFVNQLVAAGKPVVVAAFGSPYLIGAFPNAKTWLAEFATSDVAQRAAARALVGEIPISGKIPVSVPGAAKRGDGMQVAANPMTLKQSASLSAKLKPVYDVMQQQVADDAFPGMVLAVGYKGELTVHAAGKMTRDAKAKPMKTDTLFDVASMTKVIVTTTLTMMLVEQKKLDLDAPVERYLPEWAAAAKSDPNPEWRAKVTVRMLMLHDSGLPAHRDFFLQAKGYDPMLKLVLAEPLVREPATQVEYSDLGMILEGEIVHRLFGQTLDKLAQEKIFKPLGMKNSLFNPPVSMRGRIAPTEVDKTYRKKLMWGEVHDENAWAMGGVAGHAGLFTTAGDIAIFAQMMLNKGIYGHTRLVESSTIDEFTTRHQIGNSFRAIGWDVPTSVATSGHYFDDTSYGHTGFTGTSIWVDPQRDLFVIMLTNRVNPTRDNEKIRQARPAVHDAIFHALGLATEPPAR
jgi:beta-glucosidase-like glycosyl hydrolase/CubicO group peptidase (beta-lactamase class C family)